MGTDTDLGSGTEQERLPTRVMSKQNPGHKWDLHVAGHESTGAVVFFHWIERVKYTTST